MSSSDFKTQQLEKLGEYIATMEIELGKLLEDKMPEHYQLTGPLYNDGDEKLIRPVMKEYIPTWENIDMYVDNLSITRKEYESKLKNFIEFCKERNAIKKMFADYYIAIERYNQLTKFVEL